MILSDKLAKIASELDEGLSIRAEIVREAQAVIKRIEQLDLINSLTGGGTSVRVAVGIGNSDNKLTQRDWSLFIQDIATYIHDMPNTQIHFFSTSHGDEPWQNALWLIETPWQNIKPLKQSLVVIRTTYRQDSAFFMVANGEFI